MILLPRIFFRWGSTREAVDVDQMMTDDGDQRRQGLRLRSVEVSLTPRSERRVLVADHFTSPDLLHKARSRPSRTDASSSGLRTALLSSPDSPSCWRRRQRSWLAVLMDACSGSPSAPGSPGKERRQIKATVQRT